MESGVHDLGGFVDEPLFAEEDDAMLIHKEFATCILEVEENGIATLTMNDERRMNPFNEENLKNIISALEVLRQSNAAQVLIVTGQGLAFSTGGDIKYLQEMDSIEKAKWTFDAASYSVNQFYDLEIPVIAAVNGIVAGAALALIMACDLIIASEQSSLFFSFRQIAFTPDSGTSYFLVHKLGYHKAAEILFFGRRIESRQAAELGLVNKVVADDQLMPEAKKWAGRIVNGPMQTIAFDKKLLRAAQHNTMKEQQELESMYQLITWSSPDFKEGVSAFMEGRKPSFTGKYMADYQNIGKV